MTDLRAGREAVVGVRRVIERCRAPS